jgi:hypothetical protein
MIRMLLGILLLLGAIYLLYKNFGVSYLYSEQTSKEGFKANSQNFIMNNRTDNANRLDYGAENMPSLYSTKSNDVSGPSSPTGVNKNSDTDVYDNRGFKWNYNGSDPKVNAFTDEATNLELRNKFERTYMLDPSGSVAKYDITNNEMSPNCCPAQYAPPFKLNNNDKSNCSYAQKYVANAYSGSNYDSNSGCLCISPKQATFYGDRGGNGGSYYNDK